MAKAFVSGIGWAELQSKAVDIIDNGSIDILPDGGNVLGKVTVNTNVPHYDDGYEAGKQAERNAFWDAVLTDASMATSQELFAGRGWNDTTFYPTKDIIPRGNASRLFFLNQVTNLKQRLINCGVVLNLASCTNISNLFTYAATAELPEISTVGANTISQTLANCPNLITIDKLVLRNDGSQTFSFPFYETKNIENITIEGVIGQNGFDLSSCTKLSKASITSVMNALDTNTYDDSRSVTISKAAIDKAFEETEGANNGSDSSEWIILYANAHNHGGWSVVHA